MPAKKKKTIRGRTVTPRIKKRIPAPILQANTLGVADEYIVHPSSGTASLAGEAAQNAVFSSSLPPANLPIAPVGTPVSQRWRQIASPLVPARTSFWLGVGFGMIVVGMLMIMAWQLVRFDVAEALVLGLGR